MGAMNARHKLADKFQAQEMGRKVSKGALAQLQLAWTESFEALVESIRFVAQLSQCDGALVLTSSLNVLGFGCEIVADLRSGTRAFSVQRDYGSERQELDVEQFGMRHRSAIKLVSQCPGAVAMVVSQDGPITAIWTEREEILVRPNTRLVSINLPWA